MHEGSPKKEKTRQVMIEGAEQPVDLIVGALIFRHNEAGQKEILLVQNKRTGMWYLPGGKIRDELPEQNQEWETMKAGLLRELKEELGIENVSEGFFNFSADVYEIGSKQLAIANVTLDADKLEDFDPELNMFDDVGDFKWTTDPFGEIGESNMTPQVNIALKHWMENEIPEKKGSYSRKKMLNIPPRRGNTTNDQ